MFIIDTPIEPTDAPTEAPVADVDIFDDAATSQFPREYVEKLRREAADYRTKYAPYRDTFEGVDPDTAEYLLDVNRLLLSPDKTGAIAELRDLLKHLDPDSAAGQAVATAIDDAAVDPDAPLTLNQWEKIQSDKASKQKSEDDVNSIYETAKSLDPSYDRDHDEYGDLSSLLFIATHKTKGDLAKAHAFRSERFNKVVEAEVEKRLSEVRDGSRKWAPATSTGDVPAEPKDEPKTFADARKRASARIDRFYAG